MTRGDPFIVSSQRPNYCLFAGKVPESESITDFLTPLTGRNESLQAAFWAGSEGSEQNNVKDKKTVDEYDER